MLLRQTQGHWKIQCARVLKPKASGKGSGQDTPPTHTHTPHPHPHPTPHTHPHPTPTHTHHTPHPPTPPTHPHHPHPPHPIHTHPTPTTHNPHPTPTHPPHPPTHTPHSCLAHHSCLLCSLCFTLCHLVAHAQGGPAAAIPSVWVWVGGVWGVDGGCVGWVCGVWVGGVWGVGWVWGVGGCGVWVGVGCVGVGWVGVGGWVWVWAGGWAGGWLLFVLWHPFQVGSQENQKPVSYLARGVKNPKWPTTDTEAFLECGLAFPESHLPVSKA